MNRQLSCNISKEKDSAIGLAAELVQHGFIHEDDSQVRYRRRPVGRGYWTVNCTDTKGFINMISH